jgi:hypothetical protein
LSKSGLQLARADAGDNAPCFLIHHWPTPHSQAVISHAKEAFMKSAVVVIDVQTGLFDGNPRPYEADEVVKRINSVTDKARASGVPVIFIQSEHSGFLEYGTDRWYLQPGLTVKDGDIKIRKTMANAFLKTNLDGGVCLSNHCLYRVSHCYAANGGLTQN